MIYLLDTNIISDLMAEDAVTGARLNQLAVTDRVVTCSIAIGELLFGLERMATGKRQNELRERFQQILNGVSCEPVPEIAAMHYAVIKRACQKKGMPRDENDLWIAATALALGATLVTRDSDFQTVDGLIIENWSGPQESAT